MVFTYFCCALLAYFVNTVTIFSGILFPMPLLGPVSVQSGEMGAKALLACTVILANGTRDDMKITHDMLDNMRIAYVCLII